MRALALLVLSLALATVTGCSLVFGSSHHVAQYDAGPSDAGLDAP